LVQNIDCALNNLDLAVIVFDGDDNWTPKYVPGIDLRFRIQYSGRSTFSGIDHDHKCIADAISQGTCSTVEIANGASCISHDWLPPQDDIHTGPDFDENPVLTPGPAYDPFKTQ